MADSPATRSKHEQRRRDAGLVKISRWVRAEDRDAALEALEPFTDRARMEPLKAGRPVSQTITGLVYPAPLGDREKALMRKIGLTYDRSLDQWIVPKDHDIPARVLELLASEATAVFRDNCSG